MTSHRWRGTDTNSSPRHPARRPIVSLASLASLAGLAVLAVAAGACVGQTGPSAGACDQPSVALTVTLPADGALDPSNLSVCHDQQVTLTVVAKRQGTLHIHGYTDQDVETDLHAGDTAEIRFTATHVGQFVMELHPLGSEADGAEVGVLTVHDR
jgi:hypothetical protein